MGRDELFLRYFIDSNKVSTFEHNWLKILVNAYSYSIILWNALLNKKEVELYLTNWRLRKTLKISTEMFHMWNSSIIQCESKRNSKYWPFWELNMSGVQKRNLRNWFKFGLLIQERIYMWQMRPTDFLNIPNYPSQSAQLFQTSFTFSNNSNICLIGLHILSSSTSWLEKEAIRN